jgi:pimeloyl-ACP methyl ester carboxylesterase
MSKAALVLVHGASHAGDCWEPTVAALREIAPDVQVLAVDLPGRRSNPGDLGNLTIDDCVASVVDQIDAAGLDEVVIVGHSMAGIIVPGVVARLGAARVRRLVMLAACVPPDGCTVLDTLNGVLRRLVVRAARRNGSSPPLPGATFWFCNGMSREQKQFVRSRLCPDSTRLALQTVDRSGLPAEVPRTWLLTLKDRAQRPAAQRRYIENLGGVEDVVELPTCHDAMVSEPQLLARVLAVRC